MSDLVYIAVFKTAVEADLARLFLENEGIYTVVVGGTGYRTGAPKLMVLDDQFEEAKQLLRGYFAKEGARSARDRNRPD